MLASFLHRDSQGLMHAFGFGICVHCELYRGCAVLVFQDMFDDTLKAAPLTNFDNGEEIEPEDTHTKDLGKAIALTKGEIDAYLNESSLDELTAIHCEHYKCCGLVVFRSEDKDTLMQTPIFYEPFHNEGPVVEDAETSDLQTAIANFKQGVNDYLHYSVLPIAEGDDEYLGTDGIKAARVRLLINEDA